MQFDWKTLENYLPFTCKPIMTYDAESDNTLEINRIRFRTQTAYENVWWTKWHVLTLQFQTAQFSNLPQTVFLGGRLE